MTSAFEALRLAAARKPAKIVVLPETAFTGRPKDLSLAVGLRLLSEQELQTAKSEASRAIERLYSPVEDGAAPDYASADEAWSDHAIAFSVAAAATDPNNASLPWLEAAPDRIQGTLTPEGIRFLWDALEVLHAELSPIARMVSDEALPELRTALTPEALQALPSSQALRVRRLLGAVDEILRQ